MALEEKQKRVLEELTIEWLLQIRKEYLRSPQANVLKWADLLLSRLRISARTADGPEELGTSLRKRLCLQSPTLDSARSFDALVSEVRDQNCAGDYLRLVESRSAYVMAMVRVKAQEAKEAREAGEKEEAI